MCCIRTLQTWTDEAATVASSFKSAGEPIPPRDAAVNGVKPRVATWPPVTYLRRSPGLVLLLLPHRCARSWWPPDALPTRMQVPTQ
jgi:hypothetical protein